MKGNDTRCQCLQTLSFQAHSLALFEAQASMLSKVLLMTFASSESEIC